MLKLKFDVCVVNACSQISFTETTGAYSASFNTTGYGADTIEIADIKSAVLTVTSPSGTIYTYDLYDTELFPNVFSGLEYLLPTITSVEDGKWCFNYTIDDGSDLYTTEVCKLFYCNSECCVSNMLSKIEACDCKLNIFDLENYMKASTFLESLKEAAICGDVVNFNSIKKIIDKLCKNNECKTCK